MKRNDYITDAQVVHRASEAVRLELEKKKALGLPAVVYDSKTRKIYEQHSDGSRTEISAPSRRGRYSERIGKTREPIKHH